MINNIEQRVRDITGLNDLSPDVSRSPERVAREDLGARIQAVHDYLVDLLPIVTMEIAKRYPELYPTVARHNALAPPEQPGGAS